MIFLQAMGVIFCVILGVCGIVGSIVWIDGARVRRTYVDIKLDKIDKLEQMDNMIREDIRSVFIRVGELERDIMRMKGKEK